MNADRLLSHFERISDAPDAIDRLRRFILDLAVRGKLVEQDPREGTATDLLAQHRVVNEASGEMQPFSLPDSWAWVPIGVVCSKTGSGSTPRGGKTAYVSKGIPFLRSQNVHDDGLTLDDVAYIDAATHSKMIGTAVQPDDLLLNITGGSMGRCCHVPLSFREGNVSQHVAILRGAIPGTQAFLHKCIISPFFQSLIFDEQTGAGRGGLPKNRMDRLLVPLPPLAEQHRIVAKVDELMKLCDRLEASQRERESCRDRVVGASLKRLSQPTDPDEFKKDAGFQLSNLNRLTTKPEHIKELRKAILNLAVRGKLVPQDEKEERNPFVAGATWTEPPQPLPSAWGWVPLERILAFGPQNGLSPRPTERQDAPKAITLTATTSGQFLAGHYKRVEASLPPESEFWLTAGDLLFQRGNTRDYVGIAAIYDGPPHEFIYPDLMIKVRVVPQTYLRYIHLAATAPPSRGYFSANATGAQASMPKINHAILRQLPIPLPPLGEQKRIVAKVDELMLICDQLENKLESQQKGRRQLLEALLHEALEGVG